ncbi:hypothetical protein TREMEDRAFT_33288, partial [Tremella mesenterica DSM 1558]|uniref:uncharacterized protein n=1 Tax=Tremella mesenterica (strain ATCC 24925 / CBS 8224 / DSM 1558 / NBRC 9311 / NRRL Y-6157 / RJB 2259-6 / UBC 559-6) TaxID=578456 RepID=UPI0003F494E0
DDSQSGEEEEEGNVIRVEIGGETPEEKAKRLLLAMRKKPITSKDRAIRMEIHKLHVVCLLASARIRNRWCSNSLLKARLLSLLPHPLQAAFNIPPSRFPDRAQRSRLFFEALQSLVTWWSQSFFDIPDYTIGLRTRPWDEVQEIIDNLPPLTKTDFLTPTFNLQSISLTSTNNNHQTPSSREKGKGREQTSPASSKKGKQKEMEDVWIEQIGEGAGGERLRSVNSLMKKALQQEGSRDVSAQLFVALARACGLGTRLVYSIQAVPWRAEKSLVKKKPTGAGSGGKTVASRQGNGDDEDRTAGETELAEKEVLGSKMEESGKPIRAAGKRRLQDPADLYRLRKQKPTITPKKKVKTKQDLKSQPPVFWAEVFSRSDQRWIPVDPVSGIIRKKAHYEPNNDSGLVRMTYVVAFEEETDGHARDVTLRYAKNFGAKTSKLRIPPKKDEEDWWNGVVRFLERPYRLKRDDLEDAELETSHFSEGMPLHMNGFKDHPIYVLERHLKRDQVLNPRREIGRFKGEPVFRRSSVQQCKTSENWMRMGRKIRDKQEPLKWVKQRAVTIQKRRAQELVRLEGGEEVQQGLYAEWQTELYRPEPIRDGIIPTNTFGNLDLYVPTMLPLGAVHLPYQGIAKVTKQLGISYAEACTGFEFKNQRAIPVITGIVVAEDMESIVLEAYWESEAAAMERSRVKAEDRALKRWKKLINGLRVKRRLQEEYGQGDGVSSSG